MQQAVGQKPYESPESPPRGLIARFISLFGPGLIAGAADDDPTGIATYAQAGAQTGYGLLWTTLITLPMMISTQYVASKVAIVHRRGLTETLRQHFPAPIVYGAVLGLIVANIINAGVDLGAIAAAFSLVLPVDPKVVIVPITVGLFLFLVFGNFNLLQNTFKWLTLALMAYIVSSFLSHPAWGKVLQSTFVPSIHFSGAAISLVVASLGGNVSPYLFFWQSDLEVDDEQSDTRPNPSGAALRRQLHAVAEDTYIGMIFSNVIIFFVEVATAATLFRVGHHNVASAAQAARALRPLLGNAATYTWAIGMTGAGLLAVPALVGSLSDAVASLCGWEHGLKEPLRKAGRFYAILGIAMLIGMGINFLGINPIQALVVSAALNGFLSPPLLVLLMIIANKRDVMGESRNGLVLNIAGWGTVGVMALAALGLLVTMV